MGEDERPEITVPSHEDPSLLMSNAKQIDVLRLRQIELSGGNSVMP